MKIIFDGDCGFCSACVRWGFKNLRVMPESVPFQVADLDQLGLSLRQVETAVWLVAGDQRYRGHQAVAQLLTLQPAPGWRALGWLMRVQPLSVLFALGYALVAKFRHLMPGATENCALPAKKSA